MKFYRISEFARALGISSSTLRNWEKMGLLLPHHKTPTGYRYYSEEQLQTLYKNITNIDGNMINKNNNI